MLSVSTAYPKYGTLRTTAAYPRTFGGIAQWRHTLDPWRRTRTMATCYAPDRRIVANLHALWRPSSHRGDITICILYDGNGGERSQTIYTSAQ